MTGPATNAASFVTIYKTLGARTAVTYLLSVSGCALLGGILLNSITVAGVFEDVGQPAWMMPAPVKYISAIILLAVLGYAVLKERKSK